MSDLFVFVGIGLSHRAAVQLARADGAAVAGGAPVQSTCTRIHRQLWMRVALMVMLRGAVADARPTWRHVRFRSCSFFMG